MSIESCKKIAKMFHEENEKEFNPAPLQEQDVEKKKEEALKEVKIRFQEFAKYTVKPKENNKTNMELFKAKYVNGKPQIGGEGPRNYMLMNAFIKNHQFAVQWHLSYNYQGKIGYSRCFGSFPSILHFFKEHYSKIPVNERSGYEYYYDTLKVRLGFDIEKYTPWTADLDTKKIDKEVLDVTMNNIIATLGHEPENGCWLISPGSRQVEVDGHVSKFYKTSFHLLHTGIKFQSMFHIKSFAHAIVQRAKDHSQNSFFYIKPEKGNTWKAQEPLVDTSIYRRRGEMRLFQSTKEGKLNSLLTDPDYPNLNILTFVSHCYGDYLTREQALPYQEECGLTNQQMDILFPVAWEEPETTAWDAILAKVHPIHVQQIKDMTSRKPNTVSSIDDALFTNTHVTSHFKELHIWLQQTLEESHPDFQIKNITFDNDETPSCCFVYLLNGKQGRTCPHQKKHTSNNACIIVNQNGNVYYKCFSNECTLLRNPKLTLLPNDVLATLPFSVTSNPKNEQENNELYQIDEDMLQDDWCIQTDLTHFTFNNPGLSYTELNTWLLATHFQVHLNGGYVWYRKSKSKDGIKFDFNQAIGFPYKKNGKDLSPDTMYVFHQEKRVAVQMDLHFAEVARRKMLQGYSSIQFLPFLKPEDAPRPDIYNTFTGFAFPYTPGDAIQFSDEEWKNSYTNPDHIKKCPLFEHWYHLAGKSHEGFKYLVRWAAERLQKPFYKNRTFISIVGPEGVGKDTFFNTIFNKLQGEQYCTMYSSMASLSKNFNSDMATNLLVLLNEVEAATSHDKAGLLKFISDRSHVQLNEKYLKEIKVDTFSNYCAINNGACIWRMDGGAVRRLASFIAVMFHSSNTKEDNEYWKSNRSWLADQENLRQLFYFLTHLDLSNFDSALREPWMDASKLVGIQEGFDGVPIRFLAEFVRNPTLKHEFSNNPTWYDKNLMFAKYKEYMVHNNYRFPLNIFSFNKLLKEHKLPTHQTTVTREFQTGFKECAAQDNSHYREPLMESREIRAMGYLISVDTVTACIKSFCKADWTIDQFLAEAEEKIN